MNIEEPQEEKDEQGKGKQSPSLSAAAAENRSGAGADQNGLAGHEGGRGGDDEAAVPEAKRKVWGHQLLAGLFDLLLGVLGTAAAFYCVYLVWVDSKIAFLQPGVPEAVKATARGNISTHVVAAVAVCGLLGWSFRNRLKISNFRRETK